VLTAYAGNVPATAGEGLTNQTVLFTLIMADPAFSQDIEDMIDHVRTPANSMFVSPSTGSGVASFFRIKGADDLVKWQGTIGEVNSGADMELLSGTQVNSGVTVAVTTFYATMSKG
jgi:hypothetical protein